MPFIFISPNLQKRPRHVCWSRKLTFVTRSDGHYGLWLDDNLENGVSSTCPTFGNEPLSDEGSKFEVLGVELWYIGT